MSPEVITQTNDRLRSAIVAVRIDRNPVTMSALYDALNFRRNARAYVMPEWERKAWEHEMESDRRNYGNVERTQSELAHAVARHNPVTSANRIF